MKKCSVINGKKGGRKEVKSTDKNRKIFEIKDFNIIILTETQYDVLLSRYGYNLLNCAISILADWLNTSPKGAQYRGKNNYAHFRNDGWVINEARSSGNSISIQQT